MAFEEIRKQAGDLLNRTFLIERTSAGIPALLLVIDVNQSEEGIFPSDVTENPVEDSSPEIADHIQRKNIRLTLNGVISETPINLGVAISNLTSGGLQAVTSSQFRENIVETGLIAAKGIASSALLGGANDLLSQGQAGAFDSVARSVLISAWERRAIFDVITPKQRYSSMTIAELKIPRDARTGRAFKFTLDLKQIRRISPLTIKLDAVSQDAVNQAASNLDQGTQVAKGLNAQKTKNASIIKQLLDFGRG